MRLREAKPILSDAVDVLINACETDEEYWSKLMTGQDSLDAEESGHLMGYRDALIAVGQLLVHNDASGLTGYVENAREVMKVQEERIREEAEDGLVETE